MQFTKMRRIAAALTLAGAGLLSVAGPATAAPTDRAVVADNDASATNGERSSTSPGRTVHATYRATDNLSKRYSATAAPGPSGGPRRGEAIGVECQVEGEPAGPNGNRLYFQTYYRGELIHVPDAWTDSPHLASQPPIAGIPMCGGSTTPTQPSGSGANTEVWCGSPVTGSFPTLSYSHPRNHPRSYGGDVEWDIPAGANQSVQLFCASQDRRSEVTAVVDSVRAACRSGVIGDGGYYVQIGLYNSGQKIGWIGFSHVSNVTVRAGQTISRWNTTLGTVGTYRRNGCWDGAHSHIALYKQVRGYACANTTYRPGQTINKSNFIGFLSRGTGTSASCP